MFNILTISISTNFLVIKLNDNYVIETTSLD